MRFTKMHALGNDFILFDVRTEEFPDPQENAKRLCHRRFGIGADQILLLENSDRADFRMRIFNGDGSEVEMCGNGIRAFAKYLWDRGISDKEVIDIETLAGLIRPTRSGEMIRVDMGVPVLDGRRIPVDKDGFVIDHPLKIDDQQFKVTCVSMGNPHAVIFIERNFNFPVARYGPKIETHSFFPKRTNVEFIEVMNRKEILMRVWERGAGETLACGTGASAAAAACMIKGLTDRSITVHLKGGDLVIDWAFDGDHLFMTGPATEVFTGEITL